MHDIEAMNAKVTSKDHSPLVENSKSNELELMTKLMVERNQINEKSKSIGILEEDLEKEIKRNTVTRFKDSVNANNIVSEKDTLSLGMDTILLIICSNRPDYLERSLQYVVKYHPR